MTTVLTLLASVIAAWVTAFLALGRLCAPKPTRPEPRTTPTPVRRPPVRSDFVLAA